MVSQPLERGDHAQKRVDCHSRSGQWFGADKLDQRAHKDSVNPRQILMTLCMMTVSRI